MPDDRESLFGESVTLDELEESHAEPEEKDGSGEPDNDDLPDAYKGKSVKEIIAIAETSRSAIQAAEAARIAAESNRQASPPPPPEPIKEMTREELQELYDKDPLEAIVKIEEQAMRRIEAHVSSRLEPLTVGTMSSAENWAREEYPDEFELFDADIKKLVSSVPNKTVFTTKQGWEDAVAYVRGQKNNFEKLVSHRGDKASRQAADESRGRERATAGFSARSTSREADRSADKAVAAKMDDTQRAIAQRFIDDGVFKNFKEYNQWYSRGEA